MTQTKQKICIVGPGFVGQATGRAYLDGGLEVAFIGVVPEQIEKLRQQGLTVYHRDEVTNQFEDFDITFLTVPTPTTNDQINLSYIESASIDLGKRLKNQKKYHVVVVKSTVLPGTTERLVIKTLEEHSGKKAGKDFGVCMTPEYLRELTSIEDGANPPIIVIGQLDERSGDVIADSYRHFKCPIVRCTLVEAEMQKYVHNLFNANKISFFNEMRFIGEQLGIDCDKIFKVTAISCEGMYSPAYGTKNLGPFVGTCLPKDTQAFHYWSKLNGYPVDQLHATIVVNKNYLARLKKFSTELLRKVINVNEKNEHHLLYALKSDSDNGQASYAP